MLKLNSTGKYLQEINRYSLLTKEQEMSAGRKIQALLKIEKILADDAALKDYWGLIEIQRKLAGSGYFPSWERWANAVQVEVEVLKSQIVAGEQQWAQLVGVPVAELKQIRSEGPKAKRFLIQHNLRLVANIAKKFQNRGVDYQDLIQEGNLGLQAAAEKFDPDKGCRFSTHAFWWIRQGMTRTIANTSRTIRIPVHVLARLNQIKKAHERISQGKGHATIEDIALELNLSPQQIRDALAHPKSISLEKKIGKDQDTELSELISSGVDLREALIRTSIQEEIANLLSVLTEREREIIVLHYGLNGNPDQTQMEIASHLGITNTRVRQIELTAIIKLRSRGAALRGLWVD